MDKQWLRTGGWILVWVLLCALWGWHGEPTATAASPNWTVPPAPPILLNPGFECGDGYLSGTNPIGEGTLIPNGWTVIYAMGSPIVSSTRRFYGGDECNPSRPAFVSRQEGIDTLLIRSQDIATPPLPGKPFEVILYQRVPATYGGAYSLSAWMTSECGDGEDGPVPCKEGYYIAKAIGIDPNGGTDPKAASIEWVENRTDRHWQNIYTSATALSDSITVFIRVHSPFQFHNNKAFVDAFSLVRAPLSELAALPKRVENTGRVVLSWFGQQSQDIELIPAGTHQLLFDVQARSLPNGTWNDVVIGATTQTSVTFQAPCLNIRYEFRVRARAEQPPAPPEGASPNHRYPGVWSKPQRVEFIAPPAEPLTPTVVITPNLFLPLAGHLMQEERGC